MANTGLAIAHQTVEIVRGEWETPANLELIKRTVAPGLTDVEFALFCHVARVRHLDPLQRQIHAVKRSVKRQNGEGYEEKMTIQTGIDGFRAIANRTNTYMPSEKLPLVEGAGTTDLRVTVWVKKYGRGQWHEYGATAYYREFVQTRRGGDGKMVPVAMWEKMPLGQTEKCAEAKALRRGWPEELGQIYVDEEMQHAEIAPEIQSPKQDRTQRELGTLRVSMEPNRGHGNEGMQRANPPEPEICAECRAVGGHEPDCPHAAKVPEPNVPPPPTEAGWKAFAGHDPKLHISYKQGRMLFAIQNQLGLTDEWVKTKLAEEFHVPHRPLIPKAEFGAVLDAIDPEGKQHELSQVPF
jgi:phage recombination protein Bet